MKYFKVLKRNKTALHVDGFKYNMTGWQDTISGTLVACQNGYHVTNLENLPGWMWHGKTDHVYEVEVDERYDVVNHGDKYVTRNIRFIREVKFAEETSNGLSSDEEIRANIWLMVSEETTDKRIKEAAYFLADNSYNQCYSWFQNSETKLFSHPLEAMLHMYVDEEDPDWILSDGLSRKDLGLTVAARKEIRSTHKVQRVVTPIGKDLRKDKSAKPAKPTSLGSPPYRAGLYWT